MLRFTIVFVMFMVSARSASHNLEVTENDIQFNFEGINDYLTTYPDAEVEQLQSHSKVRGRINYTLGSRINGDALVAHSAKNQNWNAPQNVNITLSYPGQGIGAQITYINIQVDQTTNLGQAYVIRGGLHQRFITIVVEAYNVLYVNYSADFYGVR